MLVLICNKALKKIQIIEVICMQISVSLIKIEKILVFLYSNKNKILNTLNLS